MNNCKRWKNKVEAENYIIKCFTTQNFGLSYCAACDYLGISNPIEYKNYKKDIQLGIYADFILDLEEEINSLEYELNNFEYIEKSQYKNNSTFLPTLEECLEALKNEYKYFNSEEFLQFVEELKRQEEEE